MDKRRRDCDDPLPGMIDMLDGVFPEKVTSEEEARKAAKRLQFAFSLRGIEVQVEVQQKEDGTWEFDIG